MHLIEGEPSAPALCSRVHRVLFNNMRFIRIKKGRAETFRLLPEPEWEAGQGGEQGGTGRTGRISRARAPVLRNPVHRVWKRGAADSAPNIGVSTCSCNSLWRIPTAVSGSARPRLHHPQLPSLAAR